MSLNVQLSDFVGNSDLLNYFRKWLARGRGKQPNLLVTGVPGSGKTSGAIAFFRELLENQQIGLQDDDFQAYARGQHPYRFLVIHGSVISEVFLKSRISEAIDPSFADGGVYVLIDEVGELWAKRMEMPLRPLLDAPHVTTIATAQDFKGLEKIAGNEHDRKRWEALERRFPLKIETQFPTEKELAVYLARTLFDLTIALEHPKTLITLARKFGCNPSRCLNVIKSVHARGRGRFTSDDVAEA